MKLDAMIAVELGDVVKDEREYVNLMIKELNIPFDGSLTKAKIYERYKGTILQKYGKPAKYPCLAVSYNNEHNETITEFLYKADLVVELKTLKEKVKRLDTAINKMLPNGGKKKDDFSFL